MAKRASTKTAPKNTANDEIAELRKRIERLEELLNLTPGR